MAEADPQPEAEWVGYYVIKYDALKEKQKLSEKLYQAIWDGEPVAYRKLDGELDLELARREVQILSDLEHENVVEFYGVVPKPVCIVMEFCEGQSLSEYLLGSETLTQEQAEQWAEEIAAGMKYLHFEAPHKPVVHRNLNTRNVLLCGEADTGFVAKISGLEYGKANLPSGRRMTTPGQHDPTVWKAPEVIDPSRGQPQDKESVFQYWMKADVYSYSMVLWQLCTREEPFGGDGSKAQLEAIVDRNKMERPLLPDKCKWEEETPLTELDGWSDVILAGWSHNPEKRMKFDDIHGIVRGPGIVSKSLTSLKEQSRNEWEIEGGDVDEDCTEEPFRNPLRKRAIIRLATYKPRGDCRFAAKSIKSQGLRPQAFTELMNTIWPVRASEFLVELIGAYSIPKKRLLIVWEFAPNSLSEYLQDEIYLDEKSMNQLSSCITSGLKHLHNRDICHGCLSSSNIMVWPDEDPLRAKLVDHCMYLVYGTSYEHREKYVPQEAKQPHYDIDQSGCQGDVYSFGKLLAEMYAGKCDVNCSKMNEWKQLKTLAVKCTSKIDRRPRIDDVCDSFPLPMPS